MSVHLRKAVFRIPKFSQCYHTLTFELDFIIEPIYQIIFSKCPTQFRVCLNKFSPTFEIIYGNKPDSQTHFFCDEAHYLVMGSVVGWLKILNISFSQQERDISSLCIAFPLSSTFHVKFLHLALVLGNYKSYM